MMFLNPNEDLRRVVAEAVHGHAAEAARETVTMTQQEFVDAVMKAGEAIAAQRTAAAPAASPAEHGTKPDAAGPAASPAERTKPDAADGYFTPATARARHARRAEDRRSRWGFADVAA